MVLEVDVEVLVRVLQNVEESVEHQGLELSAEERAKLVASLYQRSVEDGEVPGPMITDQLVWMSS